MHTRERRQLRLFIRRDTYGRYLSCLVYLPARPLQHQRPRADRGDPQGAARRRDGRVHRPGQRVDDRAAALRGPPARGRADRRRRHRRPRAPARRGRPLVARRLRHRRHERVRRGGGRPPGPPVRRLVPGGLQGGLPPRHRRGRPRPARGDRRRRDRRASTCRSTRRSDAGRGEARLKVFRIGPPLSLSEVLPMLSSMGVEVVDERPYELEGLDRPIVHLRLRAALRPDRARRTRASCSRTPCAPSGTATTRATGSTRWCSPPA